jgi:WhiB family redox-sensing transcriptional regulator
VWSDVNTPWQEIAACRGLPAEMFFPFRTNELGKKRALRICDRCEVTQQCLAYAMKNDEQWGIWGGLSRPERQLVTKP